MRLAELARFSLPSPDVRDGAMTLSHDGSQLLIGTSRSAPQMVLGVLWARWAGPELDCAHAELPREGLEPDVESSSRAVDVDGETAVAVAGTYPMYRQSQEQLWLVSRRASVPPRLIHPARSPQLAFALSANRSLLLVACSPAELEVFRLAPFESALVLRPQAAAPQEISAVAISDDLKHFAIARGDEVVCLGPDGKELAVWPVGVKLNFLAFSAAGTALVGATTEAVFRLGWRGDVTRVEVPNMRPWALEPMGRWAIFSRRGELCEVNVSTGDLGPVIPFPHMKQLNCCDPVRRRVACLEWGNPAQVAVFQLTT